MRREIVTTALEVGGAAALVAGVFVLFGLGWALVTFGVLAVGFSWLVSTK
jgi:hypothetical protein